MGVASLDTVPAKDIDAKMYYFATVPGTYKNFDNLVVPQGINVLYSENGSSWVNTTLLEVAQELGVSTNKVVSQKILNDALAKKFDKESVVQESGEAEDKVMSQKAVSDKLSGLSSTITEIKEKAKTASTDASKALGKAEAANKTAETNKSALTTVTSDISTLKKKVDAIPATITKFVSMTEAAYEALETKEADTYYMLTEE